MSVIKAVIWNDLTEKEQADRAFNAACGSGRG